MSSIFSVDGLNFVHHMFAHDDLPFHFFNDPSAFLDSICENREDVLRHRWKVCEISGLGEGYISGIGETKKSAELLSVETIKEDSFTLAVIKMPEPRRETEAYFIAMAVQQQHSKLQETYLTLEKSSNGTMMCGWDENGTHFNYGEGPEPTQKDFIIAVKNILGIDHTS